MRAREIKYCFPNKGTLHTFELKVQELLSGGLNLDVSTFLGHSRAALSNVSCINRQ